MLKKIISNTAFFPLLLHIQLKHFSQFPKTLMSHLANTKKIFLIFLMLKAYFIDQNFVLPEWSKLQCDSNYDVIEVSLE